MESKHDRTFLHILCEEKNINNFLDAFFGFLYRYTDFYVISNSKQKLGFPPGIAKKLVLNSMYKWKNTTLSSLKTTSSVDNNITSNSSILQPNQLTLTQNENCKLIPSPVQEMKIDLCSESDKIIPFSAKLKTDYVSDSYNGAIRENYIWSQTISDLDVIVKIPKYITSKNMVQVNISSDMVEIFIKPVAPLEDSKWKKVLSGKLSFKIRKDESIWNIVLGEQINLHLEKATERWWEALMLNEPKIDLSKIDCLIDYNDMALEEQMTMQELMWNHQRKLLRKLIFE